MDPSPSLSSSEPSIPAGLPPLPPADWLLLAHGAHHRCGDHRQHLFDHAGVHAGALRCPGRDVAADLLAAEDVAEDRIAVLDAGGAGQRRGILQITAVSAILQGFDHGLHAAGLGGIFLQTRAQGRDQLSMTALAWLWIQTEVGGDRLVRAGAGWRC